MTITNVSKLSFDAVAFRKVLIQLFNNFPGYMFSISESHDKIVGNALKFLQRTRTSSSLPSSSLFLLFRKNVCFYAQAFELKIPDVSRSREQVSYTHLFFKKRETGCISFLEPDVFGIAILHFK